MESYAVAVEGLTDLSDLENLSPEIQQAAQRAINRTLERARARAGGDILDQINFPSQYIRSRSNGKLRITQKATFGRLEGEIVGSDRPTMLARFAKGTPMSSRRAGGVNVEVARGKVRFMQRAFLMKLRGNNLGLAMRSDGPPKRAWKPKRLNGNLWLLYGPSVDQVFKAVADDTAPWAAEFLENEFNRQLEL